MRKTLELEEKRFANDAASAAANAESAAAAAERSRAEAESARAAMLRDNDAAKLVEGNRLVELLKSDAASVLAVDETERQAIIDDLRRRARQAFGMSNN